MRLARFLIVVLAIVAVAGCARRSPAPVYQLTGVDAVTYGQPGPYTKQAYAQPVPVAVAAAPQPVPVMFGDTAYTLDSGDKLRVVVFGQEGLTNTYNVDAGGNIAMPLIGAVKARGLTTSQFANAIAGKLQQGYIREPHVAVEIETYRPFFILGEVTFPGQYPFVANMTIETAVAIAGGFTPRAQRKSVDLSRSSGGQIVRGKVPVTMPVKPGVM